MKYPLTFITDKFVPANAGACARGPIIFIRPKYQHDEGIYQHELVHVKQWFFSLTLHSFLYLLLPVYKLWAEVQAYRKQLTCYTDDRSEKFAEFISTEYGLNISKENALKLLRE